MKNVVPSARRQSEAIRRMVVAAMLSAITAVLTFTPIGMIPLPPPLLSATTVHLPVILAALVEDHRAHGGLGRVVDDGVFAALEPGD